MICFIARWSQRLNCPCEWVTTMACQTCHWSPRGGYSLCDGWYICAAVLTPFFHFGRIEHDLFGVFFLIHQHKNDLLGTNPRKIRSFWPQNTIFPSIFLGPIFSGPRHTPSNFRTEYPPRAGLVLLNSCRPAPGHGLLEIDSERPVWNHVVPPTIKMSKSPAAYGTFPPPLLKPCHDNKRDRRF